MESDWTDQNAAKSDQDLSATLVYILKEHPVLLQKSQRPSVRERKAAALNEAKMIIASITGKKLNAKQILKKVANMKTNVKKKKAHGYKAGNRKVNLCPWEQDLFDMCIQKREENNKLAITKMKSSTSSGLKVQLFRPNSSSGTFSLAAKAEKWPR